MLGRFADYLGFLLFVPFGVYFVFFWPGKLRKAISEGTADPKMEKWIKWMKPTGIILIILPWVHIALEIFGVYDKLNK
jgi:hypothetical protein